MKFLMDTNIVLDAYLLRNPWHAEAAVIVKLNATGVIKGFIPGSAITDVFYILRKQVSQPLAVEVIKIILQDFEICPIDRPLLSAAAEMPEPDFEDNVQIACADRLQLDCIVTRDRNGFAQSVLPVFTPTEFLARTKAS